MRIVALEEHFITPDLQAAWEALPEPARDDAVGQEAGGIKAKLLDTGADRVRAMDEDGVTQQILSFTTPGTQNLPPAESVRLARSGNDALAAIVRGNPDRFGGWASLPTREPGQAPAELERAVGLGLAGAIINGRTGEQNIDHADFQPIYDAAAALRAPLYLHPQLPPHAVRSAYYAGLGEATSQIFAQAAPGWHFETGVQLLRLILSGTFDRLPDLQIVTGHWGEVVMFYLDRIDRASKPAGLKHPVSEYFRRNIHVTPSGIWSQRYFRWAREVIGVERIMCAVDYPYVRGDARAFLDEADLSDAERDAVAHGNWDRLMSAVRR